MMFMDFPTERAVSSEGESLATYIEDTAISYELDWICKKTNNFR